MKYLLVLAGMVTSAHAGVSTLWVSSTFPPHAAIPRAFTCDGGDKAPPLYWSGAPAGTRSFAIVVEDVDVQPPLAHWVLAVPGNLNAIEGAPEGADVAVEWDAPCSPRGRAHHYVFRVYALASDVGDPAGRVLAMGELVGLYQHD